MSFLNHIKRKAASKRRPVGNRSGFILVGLVLTMIVMAILAAAILPMFSSATLNEVSANLDHKAYYMAESGLRYVASRYLHDATGEARDDTLTALNGKSFNLSGQSGGFGLAIESFYYKTDSGSTGTPFGTVPLDIMTAATASGTTGKLAVYNSAALNYNITTCTGYTVATDRSSIGFTGAALTPMNGRIFPMASLTTTVTGQPMPATLVLGAADDLALFPAKGGAFRIMTVSGTQGTILSSDLYYYKTLDRNTRTLSGIVKLNNTGTTVVNLGASERVVLQRVIRLKSTGTVGDTSSNIFARRLLTYTLPVEALPGGGYTGINPLNKIPPDDFIKTGATASGQFDVVDVNGNDALNVTQTTGGSSKGNQPTVEAYVSAPSNPSPFYTAWSAAGGYLSYDAQVKIATGTATGSAFTDRPATYATGVIMRAKNPGQQETYYGVSFVRTNTNTGNKSDGISDYMLPDEKTLADKPMIVLWTRNGNQANGADYWLAYKTLSETGSDRVVDNTLLLKPWSTILVRILEAGSIKLTGTPATAISIGETITGGSGKAVVIRQIKDSDNNIVLLLNNIEAGFSLPATVKGASTDASWGFRDRDNYIWVFFGDESAYGTASTSATDNARLGNPRNTVLLSDPSYALYWPVTNVGTDWTAATDYFTIVQWNATLNTSQNGDPNIRLMGGTTGNEAYGIIRTNKWTDAGPYTATTFPPEFGLHALGTLAINTYFDDIAFYLFGSLSGGGQTGFYPGVVEQ
ncbi:MAG TPA: hypothetical protein PLO63_11330 [Syntrophales bacterium]|nr:hypothetical protein [Syntrophales bacterium]